MFNSTLFSHASKESFRIATALTLCVLLYQYLNINRGYWSMLTVLIIYSVPMTGLALRKAKDRLLGTTLGIIASFLFANVFLVHDYQFAYLCFLFFFPAIFYMGIKDYYAVGAFFITLIVITGITVMTANDANLNQLMAERLFYTTAGVVIFFFCELIIFPHSTQVGSKIDTLSQELGDFFVQLLKETLTNIERPYDAKVLIKRSEHFVLKYAEIRDMYYSQLYELRYNQQQNVKYEYFFKSIDALIPITGALVGLSRHCHSCDVAQSELKLLEDENKITITKLENFFQCFMNKKSLEFKSISISDFTFQSISENAEINFIINNLRKIQHIIS